MNRNIQIVGDLTSKVSMPTINLGKEAAMVYKTKAQKWFETMRVGQSFTVEARTVEGVKRWAKDWRRELRATGRKSSIKLADRGFVTKHEVINKTNGCRVWRFK